MLYFFSKWSFIFLRMPRATFNWIATMVKLQTIIMIILLDLKWAWKYIECNHSLVKWSSDSHETLNTAELSIRYAGPYGFHLAIKSCWLRAIMFNWCLMDCMNSWNSFNVSNCDRFGRYSSFGSLNRITKHLWIIENRKLFVIYHTS